MQNYFEPKRPSAYCYNKSDHVTFIKDVGTLTMKINLSEKFVKTLNTNSANLSQRYCLEFYQKYSQFNSD